MERKLPILLAPISWGILLTSQVFRIACVAACIALPLTRYPAPTLRPMFLVGGLIFAIPLVANIARRAAVRLAQVTIAKDGLTLIQPDGDHALRPWSDLVRYNPFTHRFLFKDGNHVSVAAFQPRLRHTELQLIANSAPVPEAFRSATAIYGAAQPLIRVGLFTSMIAAVLWLPVVRIRVAQMTNGAVSATSLHDILIAVFALGLFAAGITAGIAYLRIRMLGTR